MFTIADGSEAATTATETLTFTRTATLDTVSGDITYGDWIAADSDTTFDEVTSPTIAGYTANRASVAEATGVAAAVQIRQLKCVTLRTNNMQRLRILMTTRNKRLSWMTLPDNRMARRLRQLTGLRLCRLKVTAS